MIKRINPSRRRSRVWNELTSGRQNVHYSSSNVASENILINKNTISITHHPSRVDYKLACFVFSSLSGDAPPYLADDIHLVSYRRRLRSSTDRSCAVPRTHNTCGDRSFAVAGPRVWDSLPAHLRDEDITYGSFRRELKTFCFNVASGAQ